MKLATTIKSGTTAMTNAFSPAADGGAFVNPPSKQSDMVFIIEYDGSVPLNVPDSWPLPSYEVHRKLPMKECHVCKSDLFSAEGKRLYRARRTSWLFRKKGEYFWLRVCFNHMKPEMRAVIKEMYSR